MTHNQLIETATDIEHAVMLEEAAERQFGQAERIEQQIGAV